MVSTAKACRLLKLDRHIHSFHTRMKKAMLKEQFNRKKHRIEKNFDGPFPCRSRTNAN